MIRRGLLMKVKKGTYYIIPFERDPETFMPDWHLLVSCLVGDIGHYIGYYSALQVHGLITQPSLNEMVVVNKQIRPSKVMVRNVSYQFIYHNPAHYFGAKKTWVDSYHKVVCSDLEKTFIDCLFKPEYGGGVVEVAKALHAARNKIDFNKLLKYSAQFGSQSVIKRLGFLLDVIEIQNPIRAKLQKSITITTALLDTEMPKVGKINSTWHMLENIDVETIRSAIYT